MVGLEPGAPDRKTRFLCPTLPARVSTRASDQRELAKLQNGENSIGSLVYFPVDYPPGMMSWRRLGTGCQNTWILSPASDPTGCVTLGRSPNLSGSLCSCKIDTMPCNLRSCRVTEQIRVEEALGRLRGILWRGGSILNAWYIFI